MSSPSPPPSSSDLNLDNLKPLKILGKGAMGTVFQVLDLSSNSIFALKIAHKSSLRSKLDSDRRARWEISVLRRLSPPNSHPFLPRLLNSIETDDLLCWALPYCPGGDLNVLRYRQPDRAFSPNVIRFYISEIVCALEHLHDMGIAYRDLKPENVLIQSSGHVTLTDFDLSRELKHRTVRTMVLTRPEPRRNHHCNNLTRFIENSGLKKAKSARVSPVTRRQPSLSNGERSNSFVGTEEYVSPEVVLGEGHEFSVDWWALGILSYEMMYGKTPFKGSNRKETFRNVLTKQPEFVGARTDLTDLIRRLLEKDPKQRLGYNGGACEIKEHVFFNGVKWDFLTEVLRPPFIPSAEECDLTEKLTSCGLSITAYFQNLGKPLTVLPSPPQSPPQECDTRKYSLMEF